MSSYLDTPRSAQLPPFQITDPKAPGPLFWSYNFVRDAGVDSVVGGVFITRRGEWVKFADLTFTGTAKSLRKACADSAITWSDDYIGMIITSITGAGFYYCVGAYYDTATPIPAGSTADSTCPQIVVGSYNTTPIVVGRVFQS